jgi:hypothetical protein
MYVFIFLNLPKFFKICVFFYSKGNFFTQPIFPSSQCKKWMGASPRLIRHAWSAVFYHQWSLGLPLKWLSSCVSHYLTHSEHCLSKISRKSENLRKKGHLLIFHHFGPFSPPDGFEWSSYHFLDCLWVGTHDDNKLSQWTSFKNQK